MIFKYISKTIFTFFVSLIIIFIFLNTSLISKSNASSFKINEIEIFEDFNLDFNKKKVFDKAFEAAFLQLISTIIVSKDKKKIRKTNLSTIKSLIDSFNVSDEKFLESKYYAKFNVNFNKKNTYKYFESKNIFPSIPKKIDLMILPMIIDNHKNEIVYFEKNLVYNNWKKNTKDYHLLNYILPSNEIEDLQIFEKNIELLEDYDFEKIVKKYDLENYIILIIYKNKDNINILSKLYLNKNYKIFNINNKKIDLNNLNSVDELIISLKNLYEDEWKKLNLINTSIQLPLTVSLSSKNYNQVKIFENTLRSLDLVSNFIVLSFNNKNISYKIIYNGSPDKFFNDLKSQGLDIERDNQIWTIK